MTLYYVVLYSTVKFKGIVWLIINIGSNEVFLPQDHHGEWHLPCPLIFLYIFCL